MRGILKFERDMLEGKNIHVRKKYFDTSYKNHWHSYYELIYYKNCTGKCVFNGVEYKVTDNCLFFLTPTDFHGIYTNPVENSFSINISFSENIIDKNILEVFSRPRVIYDVDLFISTCFDKMNDTFKSNDKLKENKLLHIINLIMLEIANKGEIVNSNTLSMHPAIRKALTYLITDTSRNISLIQLAEKFDMSPAYFSDLFHKETGTTFKAYVNRLKVEYAKRLIENGDLSVLDVCYECGFNTMSHFI